MAGMERDAIQTTTTSSSADIEARIKEAMRSRVSHFREQSNSLTFEGVRRLMEKDLGMKDFSLDVHKGLVKQLLLDCLNLSAGNESKDAGETKKKDILKEEATESPEESEPKTDVKEHSSEDGDKMEDSPVMGLLTGPRKNEQETEESKGKENKVPDETMIKKALWKRASYIKANSEKITMAGLRRLLEEDLKLDKNSLDPFKKFVSQQLDEVLESSQPKKRDVKKNSHGKPSVQKVKHEESNEGDEKSDEEDGDDEEEEEEEEEEEKPKKKLTRKVVNSEKSKKRKLPEKEMKESSKKRRKPAVKVVDDASDADNSENGSDDGHSKGSAQKSVKKKEAPAPAYGKHVEHLKSIIKSCSMSVPPSIYKRVKQVPENKREAQLIKELEEILSKEGLSSSPSEKEIKEVRRRKERAKELEGIDMSNIVASTRRRSTTSYVAPSKPKVPVETDDLADDSEEDDEDEADENVDEDEADENVDDDEVDENEGGDDGESEEVDGGPDEDSD